MGLAAQSFLTPFRPSNESRRMDAALAVLLERQDAEIKLGFVLADADPASLPADERAHTLRLVRALDRLGRF